MRLFRVTTTAFSGDATKCNTLHRAVERSLKILANQVGDNTDSPFRVDMVVRYGGKPPVYSVMIRCVGKTPIRKKLAEVLNRKFSLGGNALALDANEAQVISQYGQGALLDSANEPGITRPAPILCAVAPIRIDARGTGEDSRCEHAIPTSTTAVGPRATGISRLEIQSQSLLQRCTRWSAKRFFTAILVGITVCGGS